MKSIVVHGPKVLKIEDHERPTPGKGQVLVRVASGGICGTDLHYYNHGGFGQVRIKQPMILGHEVSGYVETPAAGFKSGDLVAISPSRPCRTCSYCGDGMFNHCRNMRFYGSAMPFPHIQGAFREFLAVDPGQCVSAHGLTPGEAAIAEPLAVVLHSAKQAGRVKGKRVLVTGCGPIGLLAIMVARSAGAATVVATDLAETARQHASAAGADRTVDVKRETLEDYHADKGYFDILFECSGAEQALVAAMDAMAPTGTIVQLGIGGDTTVPMQKIIAKELNLKGTFRFHEEFGQAVQMMQDGRIETSPLITQTFTVDDAIEAFECASDRTKSVKTQIVF